MFVFTNTLQKSHSFRQDGYCMNEEKLPCKSINLDFIKSYENTARF
jgi:hypothetical protein